MTHYIKITGEKEIVSHTLKDSTLNEAVAVSRKLWQIVGKPKTLDIFTDQNALRIPIKSHVERK
jgi:hypothetical protein